MYLFSSVKILESYTPDFFRYLRSYLATSVLSPACLLHIKYPGVQVGYEGRNFEDNLLTCPDEFLPGTS